MHAEWLLATRACTRTTPRQRETRHVASYTRLGLYCSYIDTQLVDRTFSCSQDNPSTSPILGLRALDGAFKDENCVVSIAYATTVAFEVGGTHLKVGVVTAR